MGSRTTTSRIDRGRLRRAALATLVAGALLLAAGRADACQKERYDAASKYSQCDLRAFARLFNGLSIDVFEKLVAQCRLKYAAAWSRIRAQSPECDVERFADNGDGTTTDQLTGLQWERKTDDDSIHDKDAVYTWSAGIWRPDGTVFTSFLSALNGGSCFAGYCDWRLPTRAELQTIVTGTYPCTAPPCIDESLFGPVDPNLYWSSTTNPTGDGFVWGVRFSDGATGASVKSLAGWVRAVRGGL